MTAAATTPPDEDGAIGRVQHQESTMACKWSSPALITINNSIPASHGKSGVCRTARPGPTAHRRNREAGFAMFAADGQQGASGQLLSDRYQQAVDPPRLVAGEQLARGTVDRASSDFTPALAAPTWAASLSVCGRCRSRWTLTPMVWSRHRAIRSRSSPMHCCGSVH